MATAMKRLSGLFRGGAGGDGSRGRSSSRDKKRGSAEMFRLTVPAGCRPGQSLRVAVHGGREVDVTLPPGCSPGQQIWVRLGEDAKPRGTSEPGTASASTSTSGRVSSRQLLLEQVRLNAEATHASVGSLWQRFSDELEVQRAIWASTDTAHPTYPGLAPGGGSQLSLVRSDLSQTQALVCAAAEVKDCKQLLAALSEARAFSSVNRCLEKAVKQLAEAEEASVTWRCLLTAIEGNDIEGIETWLEQARMLGLEAPDGLLEKAMAEICDMRARGDSGVARRPSSQSRRPNSAAVEQKLHFALEVGNVELLEEAIREAEAMGHSSATLEAVRRSLPRGSAFALPSADSEASSGPRRHDDSGKPTQPREGRPPRCDNDASHDGDQAAGPRGATPPPPPDAAAGQPRSAGDEIPAPPRSGDDQSPGGQPHPASSPKREPSTSSYGAATAQGERTLRELLEECRQRGIDTAGCAEREDLEMLLRFGGKQASSAGDGDSASGAQAGQPKAMGRGFSIPVPASSLEQPAQDVSATTVWDRLTPPRYLFSKESKALYLLGIDPSLPLQRLNAAQLRSAYRRAAMESHPDRAQNHSREEEAKQVFQQVKEAFDLLNSSRR